MFHEKKSMRHYLALSLLSGISVPLVEKILPRLGSVEALFSASIKELAALKLPELCINSIQKLNWNKVDQMLAWLESQNHSVCFWFDPSYPVLLREIYRPPLMLFIRGDAALVQAQQIAIVGSRKPTPRGLKASKQFASELAICDLVVCSGLALGIDRAAHEGALVVGGKTVAVLANGLDRVYPSSHRALADQIIADGGALVSEHPLGTQPVAHYFPRRNRIISGLSLGVLVVEAAVKSGSLITARLASEQGREVFAMPGDIHSPVSSGCHYLIQNGAKLTTCLDDILQELSLTVRPQVSSQSSPEISQLTQMQRELLSLFGNEVLSGEQVAEESGLAFGQVCSMLLQLEIAGYLVSVAGGFIRTTKEPSL